MSKSVFSADRTPRLLHPDESVVPQSKRSYFSELIQSVFARDFDLQCKPVLFTSPKPGAGVSLVCSYVATELTAQGGRVLLADVQALRSVARRSTEDAARFPERVDNTRLWVLGSRQSAGRLVENRVASTSVSIALDRLKEQFTHILLDAPALSVSDDALSLAAAVHGTVLVARAGETAKRELLQAQQEFTSLGGHVLGSVFNGWTGGVSEVTGA